MDVFLLHRIHFGFTIAFHYLFLQLTMGLALLDRRFEDDRHPHVKREELSQEASAQLRALGLDRDEDWGAGAASFPRPKKS
jgi:hypothetical protein